jgi:hypothetical protein
MSQNELLWSLKWRDILKASPKDGEIVKFFELLLPRQIPQQD